LGEGNALASETDDYLVLVEPRTRGFLYVFQVDSSGRLAWLFPENEYCQQSSGSNPVSPPEMTWVPGRDLGPLRLDRVTGHEDLYVGMSGRRWERLEEALAEGSRRGREGSSAVSGSIGLGNRGVGGTVPAGSGARQDLEETVEGKTVRYDLSGRFRVARGNFLVLERSFRHVER